MRLHSIGIAHVVGAFLAAAMIWPATLIFYDYAVPVLRLQATITDPEVRPGGSLIVRFDILRLRHCPAIISQWIFDSRDIQYAIASFSVDARPLGRDVVTLAVAIPKEAAEGPARYQIVIRHDCPLLNFFTSAHFIAPPSIPFTISG